MSTILTEHKRLLGNGSHTAALHPGIFTNTEIREPNKALHQTAIPLRSIAAGELSRYTYEIEENAINS